MSKQDRQGVRTATDLDRRYDLGGMKKAVNTAVDISAEARGAIEGVAKGLRGEIDTRFETAAQETDEKIADAVEGFVSADVLEDYAKTSDLADYAKSSDLDNYAKSSDLDSYAKKTELDGYAKKTDLDNYAKKADLDGYAKASDLESTTRTANSAFDTAQGVANDVNDHLEFADGGTRIKGSFNAMLLPEGTDLDGVILPNRYIGGKVEEYQYLNCPVTTGTFFLSVEPCGDLGQILQRLTYSHKTEGKTFERVFYTDGWGAWICVADYTGAALNAIQNEVNTLGVALGEHVSSFATSMAETGDDIGALGDRVDALDGRTQELEQTTLSLSGDLSAVINDINDHFEFADGGTRIKGVFNAMLLPAGTDLDGVILPNRYIGGSIVDFRYLNCPITSGSFFLEVESCGNEGQLLQRLIYGHKTNGKTYERVFSQDGWGQWVVVADYSGAALKAIQNDIESVEAALNQYKSDVATRMTKAEGSISTISNKVAAVESSTQNLNSSLQSVSTDLQGVINDVNDHFDFNEGGITIKGAINSALIPAGTDLDSLLIPNKYIGGTVTEYNYVNCPVPSGTFSLDVDSCGNQGQFKQTLSYCNKTLGRTYERYYYGASWGEWVCVTDFAPAETSKLLWNEGVYYMTATQTVNLPEAISAQKNGIILVFSEYSGGALDSAIHCFFVHKKQVELFPGKGYTFTLATSKLDYVATKNVFIEDTKILGHADNNATGTGASGIKYTNNRFALRYVIGI